MELKKNKVSICIPAYGVPEILKKTLDSISIQSYKNYEVVISDDTPDNSVAEMILSHELYSKIRYRHNKIPLGSPENWNSAILMASGEYIKIIHHDDIFINNKALEIFISALDGDSSCDFVFSSSYARNFINNKRKLNSPSLRKIGDIKRSKYILYERNLIGAPSATMFRIRAFIPYDKNLKWLVDVDSYINNISANANIIYINQALIETASNANHQVTRECEYNKALEISEYYYIYKKNKFDLMATKSFQRAWFYLFDKYGIKSISDINYVVLFDGDDVNVFEKIILKYNSRIVMRSIKYIANKVAGKLGLKVVAYFFGY